MWKLEIIVKENFKGLILLLILGTEKGEILK